MHSSVCRSRPAGPPPIRTRLDLAGAALVPLAFVASGRRWSHCPPCCSVPHDSTIFFMALYFQQARGYSPLLTAPRSRSGATVAAVADASPGDAGLAGGVVNTALEVGPTVGWHTRRTT